MARFSTIWRAKCVADGANTLSEVVASLEAEARRLREMEAAGVRLDGPVDDDYAELVTTDGAVAKRFEMHRED